MSRLSKLKSPLLLVIILLALVLSGCSSPSVETTRAETVARDYLTYLQQGDYNQAYNLLHPGIQKILDKQLFKGNLERQHSDLYLDKIAISQTTVQGDNARVVITTKGKDGKDFTGFITLAKADQQWRIVQLVPMLNGIQYNTVVASSASKEWSANLFITVSDDPDHPGVIQKRAVYQLNYTGLMPPPVYGVKTSGPDFSPVSGTTAYKQDSPNLIFAGPDKSTKGNIIPNQQPDQPLKPEVLLSRALKVANQSKLTVIWPGQGQIKQETIDFSKAQIQNIYLKPENGW